MMSAETRSSAPAVALSPAPPTDSAPAPSAPLPLTGEVDPSVLAQMKTDWDQRARDNARHYIATGQEQWNDRDFFRSGEINVANEVMPHMHRVCGGRRSPYDLNMLEIGCGVGRMTRALARIFGHVTGVDVSAEMIEGARANLRDCENVTLVLGDGATLPGVADESQDFAFSYIVFQHIPSLEVIASYCREVFRVLRPGSLFRFQAHGGTRTEDSPPIDTWTGVTMSIEQAKAMAESIGFALDSTEGADTQYFWVMLRKPFAPAPAPEESKVAETGPAGDAPRANH